MKFLVKNIRWFFLILSVILLGGTIFWWRAGAPFPNFKPLAKNSIWELVLIKKYELCGHTEVYKNVYQSESEVQQVIKEYQNVKIERQSSLSKVNLQISDWCESCRQHRFLGVGNKEVIVRRGTPSKPGPIIESTGFLMRDLPEAERFDLEGGIPFTDEEEKLELLEGLNSLIID